MATKQATKQKHAAIVAELQRIYEAHHALKPADVVDEARDKRSPIHDQFQWDDKKAAHEHRLATARSLIRICVPTIEKPDGSKIRDPFVWVPPEATAKTNEGEYHPMSVVVKDVSAYTRALTALAVKMRAAISAAEELRDAALTVEGMDGERLAKISLAITALQTAGAAVQALH